MDLHINEIPGVGFQGNSNEQPSPVQFTEEVTREEMDKLTVALIAHHVNVQIQGGGQDEHGSGKVGFLWKKFSWNYRYINGILRVDIIDGSPVTIKSTFDTSLAAIRSGAPHESA